MRQLMQLAGSVDSGAALERVKAQGQEFSRNYAEFVFMRDFSLNNRVLAQKWIALNRVALATQKIVGGVNSQLDTVNAITRMMFGDGILTMLPEASNLYLISSNGALAYVNQELKKFNVVAGAMALEQGNSDDENTPDTQ